MKTKFNLNDDCPVCGGQLLYQYQDRKNGILMEHFECMQCNHKQIFCFDEIVKEMNKLKT